MWEPVQFSDWMPSDNLGGSHLHWELSIRFSWQFLTGRFCLRTGLKTSTCFQLASENRQNCCESRRSDQLSAQWNCASKLQDDVSTVHHHVTVLYPARNSPTPLPQFCDTAEVATILDHPREDLAKSGYRPNMKVKSRKHPFMFLATLLEPSCRTLQFFKSF